jgi:hypothetical protein
MKQTAVEWLEDCFDRYGAVLKSDFTKAKAMEKQQQGYSEEDMINFAQWFSDYEIPKSELISFTEQFKNN